MTTPKIVVLLVLSFLPLQTFAQDNLAPKVDAVFAAYDKPDSPGCALGVIRDGRLVYAHGYGFANLEHQIPITPHTVFDIGSTSKQFTATSVVLLAQQKKLSLDDDVHKYVPEIPAYGKTITIRHLLHHTSGIRDYLALMSLAGFNFDGVTGDEEALGLIARQKALNFSPGEEYLYSNSGFFLLSIIVNRVSGKTLSQFAQENIFQPLGMKSTHVHNDHTRIVPLRATAYAPRREGGFRIDMSNFEQTGDGAVMTTIEDLLLWDQNFYQGTVGGKDLLDQLQTPGVLNSGEKQTYGLGLMVEPYRGLKTVSHGGSWAGYRAELLRFPEEKFSVVCLCNLANTNPSRLARQVADIYLADRMTAVENVQAASAEPFVQLTSAEMTSKAGLYRNPSTGALRRITFADGKLRADAFGPSSELGALAPDRFRVVGPPPSIEVVFETDKSGRKRIQMTRAGSKPEFFEAIEAASPTAGQLQEYAGSYYSDELDATYVFEVEQGSLYLRSRGNPKTALQPTSRDGFIAGGTQFEFSRDARDRIGGFAVQAGRIRNVRFERIVGNKGTKNPQLRKG